MVELKAIDADNFPDAFNLRLGPGQDRFVSDPVRSLAQAYVYRDQCQPFGIYADNTMVGYVMVIYDYDLEEYDIWHMMIDCSWQGHGYGSAALDRVVDYISKHPTIAPPREFHLSDADFNDFKQRVVASGFSMSKCLPASAAATAISACAKSGVTIATASQPHSANIFL